MKFSPSKIQKINSICDKIDNGLRVYKFIPDLYQSGQKNYHNSFLIIAMLISLKVDLDKELKSLQSLCKSIPNYEVEFITTDNEVLKVKRPFN